MAAVKTTEVTGILSRPPIKAAFAMILTLVVVEVLTRAIDAFGNPAPLFLLMTVYVALVGGMGMALLSSAVVVLYGLYFYSDTAGLFHYETADMLKLLSLAIVAPSVAVLVGLLKQRADRSANRALRHERDYSAALLAAMQDGLIARDADGVIVEANESFLRMSGFARSELIGARPPYPFWPADDSDANRQAYDRFMAGEVGEFEMTFQHRDGRCFPVIASAAPTEAYHQGRRIFVSTIKDITERHHEERRLAAQYEALRVLTEAGSIEEAAPQLLRVLCEGLGWTYGALWFLDPHAEALRCAASWRRADQPAMEPFERATIEARFSRGVGLPGRVWANGQPAWIGDVSRDDNLARAQAAASAGLGAAFAFPIRAATGAGREELLGVIEFFHTATRPPDPGILRVIETITTQIAQFVERKKSEETMRQRTVELAQLALALKRSNEELDQFAYIASHDLKAPLRGIANLATWIEEDIGDTFTEEARQQMELLRGRVHRMEGLIEGILEYSRIGRVAGKIERVDVAKLLADVVDLLDPPHRFTIEIDAGMPASLDTDRLRLQQVFMNLIGNAIKHHDQPQGCVRISARELDRQYEFTVADDGPGVPPQYQEKIFVIFQTLRSRDQMEGTGVGLSLVKKTVELYGGTVRVESEGRGTRFVFTWPKQMEETR